jgi:hypothetical protein
MKVIFDNNGMLPILMQTGEIQTTISQDKKTQRWNFSECAVSPHIPNYWWPVCVIEFDTYEELQSYALLRKLER